MADQFQYIKLPDGSYGKFAADASDETIRGAIENDFPTAYHPTTGALPGADNGVPSALQGGPDPEYKPFFSGAEARDEGSGLLKAGAGVLGSIAHGVSHIPGAYSDAQRQGVKDLDEYVKPANKGETFGKVAGTLGMVGAATALPPVQFAGGLAEGAGAELADQLSPVLGKVGDVVKWAKENPVASIAIGQGLEHGIPFLKSLWGGH